MSSIAITRPRALGLALALGTALFPLCDCHFDKADRWDLDPQAPTVVCTPGELRCSSGVQQCQAQPSGATHWVMLTDCAAQGLVCAPGLLRCTQCVPDERSCQGRDVIACNSDGSATAVVQSCPEVQGTACRGGACVDLCGEASRTKSNVGCEYWAADLDNAVVSATSNAAAQQFAIVVSNPQPDMVAHVVIEQDDSLPGESSLVTEMASATITPSNLRVFKLGPREVDGSPEGEFNTGPGTALTRHGYRVRSDVPVVAYQFNPLDNVNVFSNDASLLKPVEAVTYSPGTMLSAYLVVGWPQTIAHTNDPNTDFNPADPTDLRAFVTILGTRSNTHVRFTTTTRIIPGNGLAETQPGGVLEATLGPFDVLNLESGGFNADFTGSLIEADQPIVVFSGGEASDAPYFDRLANRRCCADHLEEQLDPIRTAGLQFIAAHGPSRTQAVERAGGAIGVVDEPEYFRVLAVSSAGVTHIKTTLPPPDDIFELSEKGQHRDLTSVRDFMLTADHPVILASIQASQDAAGVRRGLPGGDPSLVIIPPMEQYRPDYVFLTPDKYAFDFLVIAAPTQATVLLDGLSMQDMGCTQVPADGLTAEERKSETPPAVIYRCQLSYPVINPSQDPPGNVTDGQQNDGVHRVQANTSVMVLVYGFDNYVSYGYAAGTQLTELSIQ